MQVSITHLVHGRTATPIASSRLPHATAPEIVTWELGRPAPPGEPAGAGWPRLREPGDDELTTDEALDLVDRLAAAGARELRLTGAPLARVDCFEIIGQARMQGLQTTVVTVGAELTPALARRLRAYSVHEVHVLLGPAGDAPAEQWLFGEGARRAVVAYRRCRAAGQPVALAVPVTPHTAGLLNALFDFAEQHDVHRIVLQRGAVARDDERPAAHAAEREAIAAAVHHVRREGGWRATLDVTVADDFLAGPYAVALLAGLGYARAARALPVLEASARHASRGTQAVIDAGGAVRVEPSLDAGAVLGSVRERPFDVLWRAFAARAAAERAAAVEPSWPTSRCGPCQWVDVCGVADRAHDGPSARRAATAISRDCYLTDAEAGLRGRRLREPAPRPGTAVPL
jgi:MoaA/NifB/PqqE/SkfB family radical SAM enzyme